MLTQRQLDPGRSERNESQTFQVRVANTRDDFERAFRLTQRAYERAGLAAPNPGGLRVTPHQLQPASTVFVATLRDEVISTISLVPDSELGLPIEMAFQPEIAKIRDSGVRLAEVCSLADRRQHLGRRIPVLRELFRWMVQMARIQRIDQLVIAVHPRHCRFYERFLACELLTRDIREFQTVMNQPAVTLLLDFNKIDRERPENYDLFFGEPIPESQLQRHGMLMDDRAYFAQHLIVGGCEAAAGE